MSIGKLMTKSANPISLPANQGFSSDNDSSMSFNILASLGVLNSTMKLQKNRTNGRRNHGEANGRISNVMSATTLSCSVAAANSSQYLLRRLSEVSFGVQALFA